MTEDVVIERQAHILHLRMNRVAKKNALTRGMYTMMADAIFLAENDPDIRVILFSGAPGCFTAGNDLKDFQEQPPRDKAAPVYRFITALAQSTLPMVAAVDGIAVGIGLTLLLHCDIILASERARFQLPFVNLGLLPEAGSTYLLPKLVGQTRASELLMTGRRFEVQEAFDLGIVSRVIPSEVANEESSDCVSPKDSALEREVQRVAEELAAKPPQALRATKRLLKHDRDQVENRIQWEILEFSERLDSAECKEALAAFQEKRKPVFTA